jgi:hypothetical protein
VNRKRASLVLAIFTLILATTASRTLLASVCVTTKPFVLRHICGIILDPAGQPIPGAQVTVSNEQDQGRQEAIAGSDGRFSFPKIPAGKYVIRVHTEMTLPAAISIVVKRPVEVNRCDKSLQIKMPLDYCPTVSIEKRK